MINILAIITLMALALFKYMELSHEAHQWKKLAERQNQDLKENNVKFKRFKAEYSKVYDYSKEYPQKFKQEQIQAISDELEQLQYVGVTLEESERKKLLNYTKKYLEELCEQ